MNLQSKNNKSNLSAGLYIVSTPIGNMEDISIRAIDVLKNSDLILCEDTRVSKKLILKYKIFSNLIKLSGRVGLILINLLFIGY